MMKVNLGGLNPQMNLICLLYISAKNNIPLYLIKKVHNCFLKMPAKNYIPLNLTKKVDILLIIAQIQMNSLFKMRTKI